MSSFIILSLLVLFVLAFVAIIFEERIEFSKVKSALFFGTLSWIILYLAEKDPHHVEEIFNENILEIGLIWFFLIAAMIFVAYLSERNFLQNFIKKILPSQISEKFLLIILSVFIFLFSSIADNLTGTLVGLTMLLSFRLEPASLIKFSIAIVYAANAGGVALITGDVTTLMIFMAEKIKMEHAVWLFIPSILSLFVLLLFLMIGMKKNIDVIKDDGKLYGVDIMIALLFITTIIAIIIGHIQFHIPPVLIFLFGLSIMFLIGWMYRKTSEHDLKLLSYIKNIEFDALFFFMGILLLIGVLKETGILSNLTILYSAIPSIYTNYIIGIFSAVIDNIPLTAVMLKAEIAQLTEKDWLMLTYSVGVGGSLLSIGSAAGIVAMSKIKELTFMAYLKYTPAILIAYTAGYILSYIVAGLVV